MMCRLYKIIGYLAVSFCLSYLAVNGDGIFISSFTNNIIALLATLLALNITTSALISSEVSKIKYNYPQANVVDISKELKTTLIKQIVLLLFMLVITILSSWIYVEFPSIKNCIMYFVNASAIYAFLYYIEVIYDLGKGLFSIIDFNNKK